MNERMTAQLRIIKAVVNTLDAVGISAWLFGGWGLDARIARGILRVHLGSTDFSTAYFDRQPDGSSIQLLGRWSDWLFPPGSFGDEPGTLDGMQSGPPGIACRSPRRTQTSCR